MCEIFNKLLETDIIFIINSNSYCWHYSMNNIKLHPANIKVFCRFRPFN